MEDIIDKVLQEVNNEEIVIVSSDKCNRGITIHTCINRKTNSIKYIDIRDIYESHEPLFVLSNSTKNSEIQIPIEIYQLVYRNRCKLAATGIKIFILDEHILILDKDNNETISYGNISELWSIIRNYLNALIVQESI